MGEQPLNRDFAEELRRALRSIAESGALRGRHMNFNGEIRTMANVVKVAANVLGRPLSSEVLSPSQDGAGVPVRALSATDTPINPTKGGEKP